MKNFVVEGNVLIGDDGTLLMNVHPADRCVGRRCVIHNPSDHHMSDWPLHWVDPIRIFVRVCEHGVGHPDPDQAEYLSLTGRAQHMCDGCCQVAPSTKPKSFWRRVWGVLSG